VKTPPTISQKPIVKKRDNSGLSDNQGKSGTSHESSSENKIRGVL